MNEPEATIRDIISSLNFMPPIPTFGENTEFEVGDEALFVTIERSSTTQVDIGPQPRIRTVGNVVVQYFGSIDTGDFVALTRTTAIRDALQLRTEPNGLVLRAGNIVKVGRSGSHYQVNVVVPFQFDEIP